MEYNYFNAPGMENHVRVAASMAAHHHSNNNYQDYRHSTGSSSGGDTLYHLRYRTPAAMIGSPSSLSSASDCDSDGSFDSPLRSTLRNHNSGPETVSVSREATSAVLAPKSALDEISDFFSDLFSSPSSDSGRDSPDALWESDEGGASASARRRISRSVTVEPRIASNQHFQAWLNASDQDLLKVRSPGRHYTSFQRGRREYHQHLGSISEGNRFIRDSDL